MGFVYPWFLGSRRRDGKSAQFNKSLSLKPLINYLKCVCPRCKHEGLTIKDFEWQEVGCYYRCPKCRFQVTEESLMFNPLK